MRVCSSLILSFYVTPTPGVKRHGGGPERHRRGRPSTARLQHAGGAGGVGCRAREAAATAAATAEHPDRSPRLAACERSIVVWQAMIAHGDHQTAHQTGAHQQSPEHIEHWIHTTALASSSEGSPSAVIAQTADMPSRCMRYAATAGNTGVGRTSLAKRILETSEKSFISSSVGFR